MVTRGEFGNSFPSTKPASVYTFVGRWRYYTSIRAGTGHSGITPIWDESIYHYGQVDFSAAGVMSGLNQYRPNNDSSIEKRLDYVGDRAELFQISPTTITPTSSTRNEPDYQEHVPSAWHNMGADGSISAGTTFELTHYGHATYSIPSIVELDGPYWMWNNAVTPQRYGKSSEFNLIPNSTGYSTTSGQGYTTPVVSGNGSSIAAAQDLLIRQLASMRHRERRIF